MASLANANLPSEDEEDEDYVPRSNTKDSAQTGQKRVLEEPCVPSARNGGGNVAGKGCGTVRVMKKAKRESVDALWAELNRKTNTKVSSKNKVLGISALCREVNTNVKASDPDKFWKSSLGVKKPSKPAQKHSVLAEENPPRVESHASSATVAKSALAAAKDALSVTASQMHGKAIVTETRMFGGQSVEVKKVVEASCLPEKTAVTKGFDAFLETIDNKKKVNVLDKSRSDWKDLKKGNQGLEEELETHKKSNDQYLDKVNFLHRASVKEHEKERDERLASDVRTRGRL